MKKSISIVLFVSLFCVFASFSQSDTGLDSNTNEFGSPNQSNFNLLSGLSFIQQVSPENEVINTNLSLGNAVNINQIGDYNLINSRTNSDFSNIELRQNGDSNFIEISVNAPSISETIIQNGNNNSYKDIIYNTNLNVGMNLIQNGNNLSVNRIGVNSLTNNLQLVQEGSFKTITIISN